MSQPKRELVLRFREAARLAAMRICFALFVLLLLAISGAGQKQKKPADVNILEAKARRIESKIQVDGCVRVTSLKPLRGVVIVFDFVSAENNVIATEKTALEEDVIESAQERSYHAETADTARAVRYRIRAFDMPGRELRVENSGPFPIE